MYRGLEAEKCGMQEEGWQIRQKLMRNDHIGQNMLHMPSWPVKLP
jgi:hypothetical protein